MVIDGDLAARARAARYLISVLAERRGMTATFMPKPFTDRTGSGLHLHLSLWRDGEPLFPELDDPRGLGLSKTAYSFLAGVLEHACGLSAVIAPTVNSYKRTGAAVPLAATLAAELDGIDRGLDAGELGDATGPDLPPTLLHAVDALIADPVVAGALDAAGPGVSDYVAARQRDEFLDWHAAVSPVEVDRYLTAF